MFSSDGFTIEYNYLMEANNPLEHSNSKLITLSEKNSLLPIYHSNKLLNKEGVKVEHYGYIFYFSKSCKFNWPCLYLNRD